VFGPPAPSCPLSSRGPLSCEKDVNSCEDLCWFPHHRSSDTRSGSEKEIAEPACWAARLAWVRSRGVGSEGFCFQPVSRFGCLAYVRYLLVGVLLASCCFWKRLMHNSVLTLFLFSSWDPQLCLHNITPLRNRVKTHPLAC